MATVIIGGLVAAGVALYVLTRDDPSPATGPSGAAEASDVLPSEADLRAVAQAYVDAVNQGDEPAATALTCARTGAGELWDTRDVSVERGYQWVIGESAVEETALGGVQAWVGIGIDGNDPQNYPPVPFEVRDGTWCVVF